MIYIKEKYPDNKSVLIQIEGNLDSESLQILEDTCKRHLNSNKKLSLDLRNVIQFDRKARDFVKKIRDTVNILNSPQFTVEINGIYKEK